MTARRELILYATPTGPLAAACDRYFDVARSTLGPTTAHDFPPHCTLTGFFRRDHRRADEVVTELGTAIRDAGPVPPESVEVVALGCHDGWVGLELRSAWLQRLTAWIVAAHRLTPGDDALRPKDWLHLSLAYGVDGDLGPYARLAGEVVDPGAPAGWEVAVWERAGVRWTRHPSGG